MVFIIPRRKLLPCKGFTSAAFNQASVPTTCKPDPLWFDAGCAREASASNQQGKRMKHGRLPGLILMAVLASAGAATAQTVTVGATSSTSDAPIYIAGKKGFFRQEGSHPTVSNF